MKIDGLLTDAAVLEELGARLSRHRIEMGLTQAALAKQAGVSKRTVERIEDGHATQTPTLIRILRVLQLMAELNTLVPEPRLSPMEYLKLKGKERRRAYSPRPTKG